MRRDAKLAVVPTIETPFHARRLGAVEDIGSGIRWDPARLAHEIERRAATLQAMGIGRGSVVAIAHGQSAHFFADLLATWHLGASAACLDQSLTGPELETIIGFAKPAALLVRGAAPAGTIPVRIVDLEREAPARVSATLVETDLDTPALILFTSGTTGAPKGVVLSFRAIRSRIAANVDAIGADTLRRTLVTLPTHFGHGLIGNSLTPLLSGGEIVLHPTGVPLMRNLGRIVDDHQITFMTSVPALWRMATRHDAPSGRSLLRVHVGSAPFATGLWSQVVDWTRAEVVNCYGLTETANWVAGASSRGDIADGLVGEPWGTTVAVMDDDGTIRKSGAGEIVVRSPAMMSGYLDRPDLTAAVLRDGWLHTGDRGEVDQHGRLWLAGRIKDEINRAGVKVQPAEVDLLLDRHPDVAEACVFSVPDAASGELVAVAVKLVDGAAISPKDLEAWCRERLRREWVPEHWFVVDELPRNARGKISRDAVRRMLVPADEPRGPEGAALPAALAGHQPANDRDAGPASDERIRAAVERAWTEAFGRQSLADNQPWDEAGGDSMDTLRFWFALEELVGVPLSFDLLEPGATANMLVEAIRQSADDRSASRDGAALDPSLSVVLMPPLEGDMPHLARLRAAFAGRVRFEVVHYPPAAEILRGGGGFDTIVNAALAQIRARGRRDQYCLLGISSGGYVAWEVARRLLAAGERVRFMGLIDTRRVIEPPQSTSAKNTAKARAAAQKRKASGFRGVVARKLASLSLMRWHVRLLGARLLPARKSARVRMGLGITLRRRALRYAVIAPLAVRANLFRTSEQWPGSYDYGWGELCGSLSIVPIEGDHLNLFEPQHLDSFCNKVVMALDAAGSESATDVVGRERIRRAG